MWDISSTDSVFRESEKLSDSPKYGCYVHVPFCAGEKCPYCGFYSIRYSPESATEYIETVLQHARSTEVPVIDTLYFGGGTPTSLSPEAISRLITKLKSILPVEDNSEITVEANPETVDNETTEALFEAGVNRVSLGAQSFRPAQLKTLGRRHDIDKIYEAYEILHKYPFSLSFDLIFGIPRQSVRDWEISLDKAIELGPDHISIYCLSFESGTPFADALRMGAIYPVGDDVEREMYDLASSRLTVADYGRYEISNFAKPKCESRHNLKYWTGAGYIAFGPAAHGYIPGPPNWTRYAFPSNLEEYTLLINSGREPLAAVEKLDLQKRSAEFLMLRLRLDHGFSEEEITAHLPELEPAEYIAALQPLIDDNKILLEAEQVRIAPRDMFISDAIIFRAVELTDPYIKEIVTKRKSAGSETSTLGYLTRFRFPGGS